MTDSTFLQLGTSITFASILLASLLGSPHCAGMCGGFAAIASSSSKGLFLYNFGRLITYAVLGGVAGALGGALNLGGELVGIANLAALAVGVVLIALGISALKGSKAKGASRPISMFFEGIFHRVLSVIPEKVAPLRALALGLLSTLLPCGWLYTFATVAAASGEWKTGALIMGVFWIGTVPVLVGVGEIAGRLTSKYREILPRLVPALLILGGAVSVWIHLTSAHTMHCH